MPKTIKEVLESLDKGEYLGKGGVDTALAEIRQLLKECEPEIKLPESFNFGNNNAIREYTANIEKRLG